MAKKVVTTTEFVDDIDGGKAAGTVRFAFEGTNYEIDLSKRNRTAFEKALKPYVGAARRVRGARRSTAGSRSRGVRATRSDVAAVREWARANGHEVSDRGRIAGEVQDLYDAAH